MKKITVKKSKLYGDVIISGAKNSILPIMAATILANGKCKLDNIPNLSDISIMSDILRHLGAKVERGDNYIEIDTSSLKNEITPYELVSKMRASFLILGPMLSRFNEHEISMPGGCSIGSRPIDLHLKGFEHLGVKTVKTHGSIKSKARKLTGSKIYLDFPSVGATENIMMAAVLAKGETIIENAAKEPEIVDLANFLSKMGAKIKGAGTQNIKIIGTDKLKPCDHTVIPDRIEASTFMVAAAITNGNVLIKNVIPSHLSPISSKLIEAGCTVVDSGDEIRVIGTENIKGVDIKTMPYPGFPTDVQSIFMSLLLTSNGASLITETVFENRFMTCSEFEKMGADIKVDGKSALIRGVDTLEGCDVSATDLRSGAALVLAGLISKGETRVSNVHHIERGYDNIVQKLKKLGADIYIEK